MIIVKHFRTGLIHNGPVLLLVHLTVIYQTLFNQSDLHMPNNKTVQSSVLQYIYIFKPNVFKSVLFRNLTDVLRRVCVYFSDSLLDLLTDSLPRKGAKAITTDCLRLNRGDIFKTEELAASSLLPKAAHYLQY